MYEELKKRLQACIDSSLKEESKCDAVGVMLEVMTLQGITEDQFNELATMYFKVKTNADIAAILKSEKKRNKKNKSLN